MIALTVSHVVCPHCNTWIDVPTYIDSKRDIRKVGFQYCCHCGGYLFDDEFVIKHNNEIEKLKDRLKSASEAIKILSERPDEKCTVCKFKNEACIDCSFVYEHDDWFKEG